MLFFYFFFYCFFTFDILLDFDNNNYNTYNDNRDLKLLSLPLESHKLYKILFFLKNFGIFLPIFSFFFLNNFFKKLMKIFGDHFLIFHQQGGHKEKLGDNFGYHLLVSYESFLNKYSNVQKSIIYLFLLNIFKKN